MSINTINFNTPFLLGVPNSRVSPEWIRLLGSVVATISGGSSDIAFSDLQTLVLTERTQKDDAHRLDELDMQVQRRQQLPALLIPDDLVGMPRSRTDSSANTVEVMDDLATNVTMYPVWSNGIAGKRQMKTSSTLWTFNPSTGRVTSTQVVATAGFGCNGAAPQTAFASGGAAPAGGTGTAAGGWDTAAHRDAAITLLNNMRSALVANGIMS